MPKSSFIQTIIAGNLADEYIINTTGKASNHICGGPLLYAAAGASSSIDQLGLVGRIGSSFPKKWLDEIEKKGFDIRGISSTSASMESRRFFSWRDAEHFDIDNPVAHYASKGLTFPRDLLGYHPNEIPADEIAWGNIGNQIRKELPQEFIDINSAHICPLDFSVQAKIINLLETGSINTLSISPSNQYMKPEYLDKLQVIIKGAAIFLPTETQIISLCHQRTRDLWQMAEMITEMGCERVVILQGLKGCSMYDAVNKKRYKLPAYPTRWLDPTGMDDTFAGAFISEYKNSYDPLRALINGCVYASIKVEGTGPFYILDALPGLAEARAAKMESLLTEI